MDIKNFKLSPWHVYTCVFIGFWICCVCFNSFASTLILCLLFGIIADYLNKLMTGVDGEEDNGYGFIKAEVVTKIERVVNQSSLTESSTDRTYVTEDVVSQQPQPLKSSFHLLDDVEFSDAPTKPLPPPPEDSPSDSEDDEECIGDRKITEDEIGSKTSDLDVNESTKAEEDLGTDLLEPLDEYDKHPIPESVEFLSSKNDYEGDAVPWKNDIPEINSPDTQEETTSNNDENTSPSQDSSFQMLDMGSDSDIVKSSQDDTFTETKGVVNTASLKEFEDVSVMSHKEEDGSITIEDNDIIENSVQFLVQFTDNSNVDSQEQEDLEKNVTENDKIRQTSKEFVDELMEEALNITSEQQFESKDLSPSKDTVNEDTVNEEDKSSHKSSPPTSPRDLMDELIGSVPPPSTSPPEIVSEVGVTFLESKSFGEEEELSVHGEIEIENKALEDNNELEELLSDAQKDDFDNHVTDHGNEVKEKFEVMEEPNDYDDNRCMEKSQLEVTDDPCNDEMIVDSAHANDNITKVTINVSDNESNITKINSNMSIGGEQIIVSKDNEVEKAEDLTNKGLNISTMQDDLKNRKDSSSDYDEENNDDEYDANDDEKDTDTKERIKRTISSDYEEENHEDDEAFKDHDKDPKDAEKIRSNSSSEYEEEKDDVGQMVKNEPMAKNRLKKRECSSDYDDGNDNDSVDDNESSDSDLENEIKIKTKTLADMDEGDPWTEKGKEEGERKMVCSEDSEENIHGGMLHHLDSDDLPAQDDESHRAVCGDDDDRNDEDVLLSDESEEDIKEREYENRKLSTTVPTLMEENESLGLRRDLEHAEEEKNEINVVKEDEKADGNAEHALSDEVLTRHSMVTVVETAVEAKEISDASEDLLNEKNSSLADDILNKSSPKKIETSSDVALDISLGSTTQELKEETLIEF